MTSCLLDLDREVEVRVSARLPDIIFHVFGLYNGLNSHNQKEDSHLKPPWYCNKPGWRSWCCKHNAALLDYTLAAIELHRVNHRWRRNTVKSAIVESAIVNHKVQQKIYRGAPCTCFIELQQANKEKMNR